MIKNHIYIFKNSKIIVKKKKNENSHTYTVVYQLFYWKTNVSWLKCMLFIKCIVKKEIYYMFILFFFLLFLFCDLEMTVRLATVDDFTLVIFIILIIVLLMALPASQHLLALPRWLTICCFSYLRCKSRTIQKYLSLFLPTMFQLIQILLMIAIMRTWIFRMFIEEIMATLRIWIWFVNFFFRILIWKNKF